MNEITAEYLTRAETWLVITTLIYFMMNGAGIFETVVVVPKWTLSPPESFELIGGKYALNLKTFWIVIHSIHEITFILAIIFCWKIVEIRNELLILFAIHFAVRIWTIAYFARNIMDFQKIASIGTNDTELLKKASRWKYWNYVRTGIFIAVSIGLIPVCLQLYQIKIGI